MLAFLYYPVMPSTRGSRINKKKYFADFLWSCACYRQYTSQMRIGRMLVFIGCLAGSGALNKVLLSNYPLVVLIRCDRSKSPCSSLLCHLLASAVGGLKPIRHVYLSHNIFAGGTASI